MTFSYIAPDFDWKNISAEGFSLKNVKGTQERPHTARVFAGKLDLDVDSAMLALEAGPPGQVETGSGFFDNDSLFGWVNPALYRAEIDADEALMDRDILWCKGAAFHDDVPFNKVFCVMHVAGPAGDLVFPRLKSRVAMSPGVFVIFDCREPHAFLKPGATRFDSNDYVDAAHTVFAAQDLDPFADSIRYFLSEDYRRPVPKRAYVVDKASGDYIAG